MYCFIMKASYRYHNDSFSLSVFLTLCIQQVLVFCSMWVVTDSKCHCSKVRLKEQVTRWEENDICNNDIVIARSEMLRGLIIIASSLYTWWTLPIQRIQCSTLFWNGENEECQSVVMADMSLCWGSLESSMSHLYNLVKVSK